MTDNSYDIEIPFKEVDAVFHFLENSAVHAAQAHAERRYLEEYRKTVKAQIMGEHADEALGTQERMAYADERYIKHLKTMREAVQRDLEFQFKREAANIKFEAWRTLSANARRQI